jgi:predicted O-methyltransferase YrrM
MNKYESVLFKCALKTHVVSHWFAHNKQKREYVETNIKQCLLPIILFTEKVIIPPNKLMQELIEHAHSFEDMLALIEKYIGAFISPDYKGQKLTKSTGITIKLRITPRMLSDVPIKQLMYDKWFSSNTRRALEGAVQYYRPKVVVELGVYLGCSTVSCLNASKGPISYYGFDYFTHICTNPENISFSPLDRFFLDFPKLETAVANVIPFSKKHNINFILYDVLKSCEYLSTRGIVPDLLFIDSIKDEHNLNEIIHKYLLLNPDIVIVGDDMIFESVKKALKRFNYITFGDEAYLIQKAKLHADKYPQPKILKYKYPVFHLSKQEQMLVPKKMHGYL